MASPPKRISLRRGNEDPWEASLSNPSVAFFHGHLRKARVMLKVDRKTEMFGN
jgi:hypothetical protein